MASAPAAPLSAPDPNAIPVAIRISDIDVVRMGFGPKFNLEAMTEGASARIGEIGRAILQVELPKLFGFNVAVSRSFAPLSFETREGLTPGKIRQGVAHVLENHTVLLSSMVRLTPVKESEQPAEDIDEYMDEVIETPQEGSPDPRMLRVMRQLRQGTASSNHPGYLLVEPFDAIHLSIWATRDAEVAHEPFQRLGPIHLGWSATAMLEMLRAAPAVAWPALFKQAVDYSPQAALTVLEQRLWPSDWTPAPADLKPLLAVNVPAIRAQAIQHLQRLQQEGGMGAVTGTGGDQKHTGPERRTVKKFGY